MSEGDVIGWVCGAALFLLFLVYVFARHYFLVRRAIDSTDQND
jgi:hypothetical protein